MSWKLKSYFKQANWFRLSAMETATENALNNLE